MTVHFNDIGEAVGKAAASGASGFEKRGIYRSVLKRLLDFICCRKKSRRPSTKSYATIATNGDDSEAYRD